VTQLDLLALLTAPAPADPTVEVIARWLGPHGLNRVVRALGTPNIDWVRRDLAHQHDRSCGGPGHRLRGSATGIVVEQWFGAEPFKVTWNRMFAVIRARTTPELAEALGAVCAGFAGGITPRQQAAADVILPSHQYSRVGR
jgi:hypothetical protein